MREENKKKNERESFAFHQNEIKNIFNRVKEAELKENKKIPTRHNDDDWRACVV
jgi:hypothetical protein